MIHFVVHDEHDSVGVIVVEGVKSGQQLTGWIMDQDKQIKVRAQNDIPIGHKLAIQKLAANDTVIKYGTDIGRTANGRLTAAEALGHREFVLTRLYESA